MQAFLPHGLLTQQVTHLGRFGIQIMFIIGITAHNQRDPLHDIDPRFSENLNFLRVIGEQTHCVNAQQLEHIRAEGESRSSAANPNW